MIAGTIPCRYVTWDNVAEVRKSGLYVFGASPSLLLYTCPACGYWHRLTAAALYRMAETDAWMQGLGYVKLETEGEGDATV